MHPQLCRLLVSATNMPHTQQSCVPAAPSLCQRNAMQLLTQMLVAKHAAGQSCQGFAVVAGINTGVSVAYTCNPGLASHTHNGLLACELWNSNPHHQVTCAEVQVHQGVRARACPWVDSSHDPPRSCLHGFHQRRKVRGVGYLSPGKSRLRKAQRP
jgi:hypothetical protein